MASIRQIAKLAGVSPATVSRILKRDPTFAAKEETRERVFTIARKLKYEFTGPYLNTLAMNIKQKTILIIMTPQDKDDLYFSEIDRGIKQQSQSVGVNIAGWVEFPNSQFDISSLTKYSAIILIGTFNAKLLSKMYRYNKNLVIIDEYRYFRNYDLVKNSYETEEKFILDRLYKSGHHNIAFLGGIVRPMMQDGLEENIYPDVRTIAYQNWMAIHHLRSHTFETWWLQLEAYEAAKQIVNSEYKVDAIVVASDKLAGQVYRAVNEKGLTIPDDIAIASFDNSQKASLMNPQLSSVSANTIEMGRMAVRLVVERLVENRDVPVQVVLPSKLVERQSI